MLLPTYISSRQRCFLQNKWQNIPEILLLEFSLQVWWTHCIQVVFSLKVWFFVANHRVFNPKELEPDVATLYKKTLQNNFSAIVWLVRRCCTRKTVCTYLCHGRENFLANSRMSCFAASGFGDKFSYGTLEIPKA